MKEEAITVPGWGRWCCAAESFLVKRLACLGLCKQLLYRVEVRYPRFTPSTWKSTHHTPVAPSSAHSTTYRIVPPTGSHSISPKKRTDSETTNGRRSRKRKTWTGVHARPTGAGGTGRKGAMAVPAWGLVSWRALLAEAHMDRGLLRTLVAELAVFLHGAVCLLLLFHVFRGREVGCVQ